MYTQTNRFTLNNLLSVFCLITICFKLYEIIFILDQLDLFLYKYKMYPFIMNANSFSLYNDPINNNNNKTNLCESCNQNEIGVDLSLSKIFNKNLKEA